MAENKPFQKIKVEPKPKLSLLTTGLKQSPSLPIPMATPKLFDAAIEYTADGVEPPVFVAGTFNNWERVKMEVKRLHNPGLVYHFFIDLKMQVGRHQYKLFVGTPNEGEWVVDESKEQEYNSKGQLCNILIVNPKNSAYLSPILPENEFDPWFHDQEIVPSAPPGWKDKRNNAVGYE